MGASGSTDGTVKKKKKPYYRQEPEKREKTRYDPEDNTNFTSQHDASVDKVIEMSMIDLRNNFPLCWIRWIHGKCCSSLILEKDGRF